MDTERKQHWEKVYATKQPHEVSWTQEVPDASLRLIHEAGLPKSAPVIDIGGGDSRLVDFLLEEGYEDITVLDISEAALDRARKRLGDKGNLVTWIASDIRDFRPERQYSIWHDRAAFHFLTSPGDIATYVDITSKAVKNYMVIGTFSETGPEKCSGLPVSRYRAAQLTKLFAGSFDNISCIREDHITPFNTVQNFLFCSFRKR